MMETFDEFVVLSPEDNGGEDATGIRTELEWDPTPLVPTLEPPQPEPPQDPDTDPETIATERMRYSSTLILSLPEAIEAGDARLRQKVRQLTKIKGDDENPDDPVTFVHEPLRSEMDYAPRTGRTDTFTITIRAEQPGMVTVWVTVRLPREKKLAGFATTQLV